MRPSFIISTILSIVSVAMALPQATEKTIPTLHLLAHSAAHRCLWALEDLSEERGIQYKLKKYPRIYGVNLDLKNIFPLGKSPIVTLECTAEGEEPPTIQVTPGVLTEAQAILKFLNQEYGDKMWTPDDDEDKRRDYFFTIFAMNTVYNKVNNCVIWETIPIALPFGIRHLLQALFTSNVVGFFKTDLQPVFQVLEDALNESKPWFSGARIGLADFNMNWGMDMAAHRGYFDGAKYPKVRAWRERCVARGGYQRALERQDGFDLKTFGSA